MTESGRARVEELFEAALGLATEDRARFVTSQCGGDSELQREVLELLASDQGAGEYFEGLHADIAATAQKELDTASRPKIEIGPWRAVELLGQGGMGVVYRAERVDGAFEQEVALKLLHLDLLTPEMQARFAAERQLLAQLSHPNIARLQDGGVTDEGRPYFIMEYVEGLPIDRYVAREIDQKKLSLDELLRLFLTVIGAVSYLHRNLIVHRDLKPSNLFVAHEETDGKRTTKLLDFGIAKLLSSGATMTRTRDQLLTPRYAAPEQLAGERITTSTDVYSLGLVLYELLTGQFPDRLDGGTGALRGKTAMPPSVALREREGRNGKDSPATPAMPWRRIPADLDNICLKAIRPEADRRYASAEQLGEDIERFLAGLPVRARASTLGYRASSFIKRHKAGVMAMAALLALVALGFGRERGLRAEAESARRQAEIETAKAVSISDFLSELLSSADPAKAQGAELAVADVLRQAAARLDSEEAFAGQPEVEARARLTLGRTYFSLSQFAEARDQLEKALELSGDLESGDLEAAEIAESLALAENEVDQSPDSQKRAETLLREVLGLRRGTLGEEHPDTAAALSNLGRILRYQYRYEEAEAAEQQALEIRQRVLGEEHSDTLRSLNSLAAIFYNTGRYVEAAVLYGRALSIAKRTLGESHPDTLRLGSNLGAAFTEQGRYREGEAVLREVVEGRLRVLGETHVQTGMSLHNLGVALLEQARYGEAEAYLKRAIDARREAGVLEGYLYSMSFLADLYRNQERYPEAEALYLETYAGQVENRKSHFPDSRRTVSSLAELYLRTGRVREAESKILSVREAQAEVLDSGHPDLLSSTLTLARVRIAQGRFEEGLELAQRAVRDSAEVLGADHPVTLDARFEVAGALRSLERFAEAALMAASTYEARRKVLGEKHPGTIEALAQVTELRHKSGRERKAGR